MSRNIIIKRILLVFLNVVTFGNGFANTTTFHLTKKGGRHFQHNFYDMWGGLTHFLPENKNDIGHTQLFLRYNNDEEREQAKNTLKTLVYDLTAKGFANCMDKYTNEYIYVQPLKGTDYTDISIDFKWTNITQISLTEG